MGLTVSFLCDRKDTNVPSSQVNFIRGFIIPTFQVLVTIFPSLGYTVENATNNMNEWQKLVDAHRLKGWTPRNVNNNNNNSDENKNLNKNNYSNNSSSIKKNNNLSNNTADKNDTKSSKDKDNILRPNINKWKPEKINI